MLRSLDFSRTSITPESLCSIAQVPGLRLEDLSLHGCKELTDYSIEILCKHQNGLKALDLGTCAELTSRTVLAVATELKELQSLSLLQDWKITDKGLTELMALPCLRTLDLSECLHVSGAYLVKGLSSPQPRAQLQALSLRNCSNIREDATNLENRIKALFKQLHQLLDDEENAMLNELKLEKEKKLESLKDKSEKIDKEIVKLTTTIKDLEKELNSGDIRIIQNFKDTLMRAQCEFQDPEITPGNLIDCPKYLGNFKFNVWRKVRQSISYSESTIGFHRFQISSPSAISTLLTSGLKSQLPPSNSPSGTSSLLTSSNAASCFSGRRLQLLFCCAIRRLYPLLLKCVRRCDTFSLKEQMPRETLWKKFSVSI